MMLQAAWRIIKAVMKQTSPLFVKVTKLDVINLVRAAQARNINNAMAKSNNETQN